MSDSRLSELVRRTDFLIAIDSDGCVFDTMEIKHKECFIPAFIKHFGLQAVSSLTRSSSETVNLYSKGRGLNRFIGYLKTLDLLATRPEVKARHVTLPALDGLRSWVQRETKLSTKTIVPEAQRTGDPDLQRAAAWSQEVDAVIADLVHHVPPFPLVRESLQKIRAKAQIVVCSATPVAALQKEWKEHDIAQYADVICGQEFGSKKEILAACIARGWTSNQILMVGDAPGDMKAARDNRCHFFPIIAGHEDASWKEFYEAGIDRFFGGSYAGDYEGNVIDAFERSLPDLPV